MSVKSVIKRIFPVEWQPPTHPFRGFLAAMGYFRFRTWLAAYGEDVPGHHLYRPLYCPWDGEEQFARVYGPVRPHTMVSADRCHILWQSLQQAAKLGAGDFIECGVFRGGTALLAALTLRDSEAVRAGATLHLVDSFRGMPAGPKGDDRWEAGDLSGTSAGAVRKLLAGFPFARVHEGLIPEIFLQVSSQRFAWAHVDVDMGKSVRDCIEFIYPKLLPGGVMIFDDYGFPSCTRARLAVDEAFSALPETPIYLPTAQCLVIKLPSSASPPTPSSPPLPPPADADASASPR